MFISRVDLGSGIAITLDIKDINPYVLAAGRELDEFIHRHLFGGKDAHGDIPLYSIDPAASAKVRSKLKSKYGHPVVVGETRMSPRKHFARFESDPSTATEILAETQPLAICRLAAALVKRGN